MADPTPFPQIETPAVDLDGLLQVLGENLYSSPDATLRELIQNAHDACVRRGIEADGDAPAPRIDLTGNPEARTLTVEDNGAGLTRAEIRERLATIGTGHTAALRAARPDAGAIGYFGLGFLSAYAVADTVELHTAAHGAPGEAWVFTSSGGRRFAIRPGPARPVGTRVTLHLKEEHAALASPGVLAGLIERYCALLPVPIHLDRAPEPLNDALPPWRLDPGTPEIRRRAVRQDFADRLDPRFSPLCSWDIAPGDPDTHGILWVQDGGSYASADTRATHLFLRGMLLTRTCRDLLPTWAGFIGCAVDARHLTPTASREDLRRDAAFDALCETVDAALLEGLRALPERHPETWRRVAARHNEALRGACIADPDLFEAIHADLTVPTTRGEMTPERAAAASGGRLLIRPGDSDTHDAMLFRAQGVPIVLGHRFAAAAFCRVWAEREGVEALDLGSAASRRALFPDAPLADAARDRLTAHLLGPEERLVVSAFAPASVPFLFVTDEEARLKRLIETDDADARIGAAALHLARLHTRDVEAGAVRDLVVNMDNPLMRRLAQTDALGPAQRHVVAALRAHLLTLAVDVAGDGVDPAAELTRFFEAMAGLFGEEDA